MKNNSGNFCLKFSIFLIVVGGIFSGWPQIKEAQAQAWYNAAWSYRKAITIDYTKVGATGAPHANFPVLINLASDTDLAADAQDNGNDILFTSSDGTTKLDHEIERFNGTTGELQAWVRVPSLSSTANTVLYMYYGNPVAANQENVTGTWDANFKGVWHLKENPAGTAPQMRDSTSNANHGTSYGSMTIDDQVAAKINGGLDFDGSNDYINVGMGLNLVDSPFTFSGWSSINILRSDWANDLGDNDSNKTGYGTKYNDNRPAVSVRKNAWWDLWSPDAVGANEWHYIVGVYEYPGNIARIYVDGVQKNSGSPTNPGIASSTNPFWLGGEPNAPRYADIKLDEARISNVARSAGWILTEYNNQNLPSTFYSVGSEHAILSISVSPTTWGVGTVDAGTVQINTSGNKIDVTNDGNVAETFTLQIYDEDDRNEWTHSSLKNGAGNNIYVLSGIFCATTDSPVLASFNETDSEDVLTTTVQIATSTKFAYTGGSANAVAVPVSGVRSLWLRLDMPTAVSGTYAYEQHTITVRIGCQHS